MRVSAASPFIVDVAPWMTPSTLSRHVAGIALGILLLAALGTAAAGEDSRIGRMEGSLSLAGGIPISDARRRTDYILLRQLDYFAREDLTVGIAFGIGGPIDAVPSTALQLQAAHNFGTRAVVPYIGVHLGVLADFFDADFTGTTGVLVGARWHIGGQWSLIGETKYYATFNRLDDSFVALLLGFSIAADPL